MRTIYIAFLSVCVALCATGCAKDGHTPGHDRPYVVMSGVVESVAEEATRATVDPRDIDGLPEAPLTVGIVTLSYATTDPTTDQPNADAWMSATANLSRGYFGGPGVNAAVVENGEINYTDEAGSAIRRLFYEENGGHYFTRVVYPFVSSDDEQTRIADLNQNPLGTEVIISGLDGTQDVMCSNLAWGNIHNPKMTTAIDGGEIVMSHLFSRFGVKVRVESHKAATQFGTMQSFVLKDQPSSVGINMINLDVVSSHELTDYHMEDLIPLQLDQIGDATLGAGYVIAPPDGEFRFEVLTTNHGWVQGIVSFADMPEGISLTGYTHDIVLTFMESGEVEIVVSEPDEYWFDWVFD